MYGPPMRRALLVLLVASGVALLAAPANAYQAQISRTSYGIPHVRAHSWGDLGFGAGYAYAEDNLCTLANEIVTVRAQRSRFFGPDGVTVASAKVSDRNIDSDFFWQQIHDRRVVERLVAQRAPRGRSRRCECSYAAMRPATTPTCARAAWRGCPIRAAAERPGCDRSRRWTSGAAITSWG